MKKLNVFLLVTLLALLIVNTPAKAGPKSNPSILYNYHTTGINWLEVYQLPLTIIDKSVTKYNTGTITIGALFAKLLETHDINADNITLVRVTRHVLERETILWFDFIDKRSSK